MTDVYRDHGRAAEERICALERDIAASERQLTPFLRGLLPAPLRARIERLAELPVEPSPLKRAEDLCAHLAALEEALALLPGLRAELLALPGSEEVRLPLPAEAGVPIFGNVDMEADRRRLTALLKPLDPDVCIWSDGTQDYAALCATLHPEGTPLSLILTCFRRIVEGGRWVDDLQEVERIVRRPEGQAWTRLARGTPPLVACPQGLAETLLLKPLGLGTRRDVTLGDRELDRRFIFDAEADVARVLVADRVRRGLLAAAGSASEVRLSIEDGGIATLTWKGDIDEPLAGAVVDILVGLRAADITPLLDARGLAPKGVPA